jgi:hypothetical protein
MLEVRVKNAILETKEKKEKLLIEQNLVKKRILMILESKNNSDKEKIAYKLVSELNYLQETKLLNEQLKDFLGKIFGDNLNVIFQTIIEPMVGSLMKSLELADYFKDELTQSLSSDPMRFSQALRSCEELTKLIADSLADAIHNRILQKTETDSVNSKFLNSALADAVKDPRFIENLERNINSVICDLFDSMSEKPRKFMTN